MRRTLRTTSRAFSLLEIMLVVVIIGLIAGAAIVAIGGTGERARNSLTRTKLRNVHDAVQQFQLNNGSYPTSLEELVTADPPYLETIPKDAWNNEFVYFDSSERLNRDFSLYSLGKDGQEGTEDDIDVWDVIEEG